MAPSTEDYLPLEAPTAGPKHTVMHKACHALALGAVVGSAVALVSIGVSSGNNRFLGVQPKPVAANSLVAFKDTVGGPGSPLAKQVVVGMDTNVNLHIAWNDWKHWSREMAPYWTEDMIYDFNYVGEWEFGPTHGLRAWYEGEHLHFNGAIPDCQWMDVIRAANGTHCTSATYGLARWVAPFAGVPPPANKPWVRIHDLDFYLLEGNRIKINWCMIDVVGLFQQVGYQVLPPSPMPEIGYRAPNAMDGFPAPMSAAVNPKDSAISEKVWRAAVEEDYLLKSGRARWWAENMTWYGPAGVGGAHSRQQYLTHFLEPLHAGFSNLSLQMDLLVCEGKYCGAHFYLYGSHTGTWLGEKATGRRVRIRCGAHAHVENGRIVEGWLIIDVPRAFADMGVDLYARVAAIAAMQSAASVWDSPFLPEPES